MSAYLHPIKAHNLKAGLNTDKSRRNMHLLYSKGVAEVGPSPGLWGVGTVG